MNRELVARLSILSIILLVMYFSIADRIELGKASNQRTKLIKQIGELQKQINSLEGTIDMDAKAISILRKLIEQENAIIVKLGGTPIPIPPGTFGQPQSGNNGGSSQSPKPQPQPTQRQPSNKPSPTNTPSKTSNPIKTIICQVPVPFVCPVKVGAANELNF